MSRETRPAFVRCRICQQLISSRNALTKQLILSLIKRNHNSVNTSNESIEICSRTMLTFYFLRLIKDAAAREASFCCHLPQCPVVHVTSAARFTGPLPDQLARQ